MTTESRQIVETLKAAGPLSPKAIADLIGKRREAVRVLLHRLSMKGVLQCDSEGNYLPTPEAST